ncbi:MAG: ubiquitin-like protein [Candidatus Thorarchaeota archaeon]
MRKKYRILGVITLYVIFTIVYIVYFTIGINNTPLFLFLTIGSVAVLSTSTIYTVIQSQVKPYDKFREKKYSPKPKASYRLDEIFTDEYLEALPSIKEYIDSDKSYEDMPTINKYIFSVFGKVELGKIEQLELSKLDKLLFIREMLYFDKDERKVLIDNMLKCQKNIDKEIFYIPPKNTINLKGQIRVYIRSLVEPGEITKLIIVEATDLILSLKERVAVLYNYELNDFLLSSGGILLSEEKKVQDYDIDDDDEIALIPSRKE